MRQDSVVDGAGRLLFRQQAILLVRHVVFLVQLFNSCMNEIYNVKIFLVCTSL